MDLLLWFGKLAMQQIIQLYEEVGDTLAECHYILIAKVN